jgi:capsular polysaccharide biosynthesis protein
LREYLYVLWQKRWIVLICAIVALGISAFISFRMPSVYRADVALVIEEVSIAGVDLTSSVPSKNLVVEWAKDPALVTQAVATAGAGFTADWVLSHLRTKITKDFVELALEGPAEPEMLARVLEALVETLRDKAAAMTAEALRDAVEGLDIRRARLLAKKSAWEKLLDEVRSNAESQRNELLAEIRGIAVESEGVALDQEQNLASYRLMKELDFLYQRLASVESLLDEIARVGVAALPGIAEEYGKLLGELADTKVQQEKLLALLEDPPSPLMAVRAVRIPSAPVGPNRKMNVAVAGVLGLFLGVLLAFFVHYLQAEPPSQRPARGEDTA